MIFFRFQLLTEEQTSGISVFVGKFSLPAIIFGSLSKVNLSDPWVNWNFWLSILLAKSLVFTAVIVVGRLANRHGRIGTSALYAIFVTQSNDFALGLPILNALFETSHPEYPSYLFLLVPIQLAILNPIALVLLEVSMPKEESISSIDVEKHPENDNLEENNIDMKNDVLASSKIKENHRYMLKKIWSILSGLLVNPIIFMTFAGLFFGSVVFKGQPPVAIDKLVGAVGKTFGALALFTLGMAMVGTLDSFKEGKKLIVPIMLVAIKTIILPVVSYGITLTLCDGEAQKSELAGFAFLVGTLPTAPTAYVFAKKYDICPDMIAGAMVVCTIVSAPIIYGSGRIYDFILIYRNLLI